MAWEPSSAVWMKIWSLPALKEVTTSEAFGNFKYICILFDFKYTFTEIATIIWIVSLNETYRISHSPITSQEVTLISVFISLIEETCQL